MWQLFFNIVSFINGCFQHSGCNDKHSCNRQHSCYIGKHRRQ